MIRGIDGLVCLDEDVARVGSHQHHLLHERGGRGGCPGYPDDDVLLSRVWGVHQTFRNLGRDAHAPQAPPGSPCLEAKPWARSWEKQLGGGPQALPLGARSLCEAVHFALAQGHPAKAGMQSRPFSVSHATSRGPLLLIRTEASYGLIMALLGAQT